MINFKISSFVLAGALSITLFCRCGNHKAAGTGKNRDSTKVSVEYIDWDSVRINGTAHAVCTPTVLYGMIGKPDSVITPDMSSVCGSFFDHPFKYVFIKGSEFEMRGDSIVISQLDFRKGNLIVSIRGLKLDKNTTLASLAQTFPNAVRRKYLLDVYGSKGKLTAINLGVDKNYKPGDTDGVWILLFKDGKLVSMEYHLDC